MRSERLLLTEVSAADVDELYALNADPRVWTHLPSGRHTTREQTADEVDRYVAAWQRDGLGYWTVRLPDDTFVGIGGAQNRQDLVWNLYYRFVPEAQGQGYASEVVAAAMAEARRVQPDRPITAYLLEHNAASARTAQRAGLHLVWRGPDAGNPDPAAVRLVYADRAVPDDVLATLTTT